MNKVSAQTVCDILNANMGKEGFFDAIGFRIPVGGDIANNSDISCSVIKSGFDTSALGFINALTDESIALVSDGNKKYFALSKASLELGAELRKDLNVLTIDNT